jgi:N-acetylneuraminic acid mutarotase
VTRRIFFLVLGFALAVAVGIDLVGSATAALPVDQAILALAPAACGTPGPWSVASPVPTAVFGPMVAGDTTYAYSAGGYSFQLPGATTQFARFDPVANTWTTLAPLPSAAYDGAAVYANGKVFVFGGTDGATVSTATRIFDVGTNSWSIGTDMPAPRELMGIGYSSGTIYIAGGSDSQSLNPQSTLYAYSVAGNSWTTLAPLPQALAGPGSGVVNGHLYIAGGRDASLPNRTTVYDYNISTNSWSSVAPLLTGVNVPGSGVVDGELVLFGGGSPFFDPRHPSQPRGKAPFTTNVTQAYDPIANAWTAGPNLNTARAFVGGTAVNNYLVAVGGFDGATSLSSVEVSNVPCGTPTPTSTGGPATNTPTPTPTGTATSPPATVTRTPTSTSTSTTAPTNTPPPTQTPGGPSATPVPSDTATNTPGPATNTPTTGPTSTVCPITFSDVPVGSTFYTFIRCLACRGIINGYPDGTFRPNNNVTRGQLSKIVANSAGFNEPVSGQMFQDVPPDSTFYDYIGRLASRGYINGYPCNSVPGEPCVPPGNLPYFRTNNNATRGQISKIVSNAAGFTEPASGQTFQDVPPGSTFYDFIERLASRGVMSGYPCNSVPSEPCVPPENRPYFRPNNNATRGQTSKIVANTFFPECSPPIPTPTATVLSHPYSYIQVSSTGFSPQLSSGPLGTEFVWTNSDTVARSVIANHGEFNSGPISPGVSWSYFPGIVTNYPYHSGEHPEQTGSLSLEDPARK